MGPHFTDLSHLPEITPEELRERVRSGEDDLMVGCLAQRLVNVYRPDTLRRMRDIGMTAFFVYEREQILARFSRPASSPLSESSDRILRRCMEHITTIRARSDALLKKMEQQCHPLHPPEEIRATLCLIEQKIWSIRHGFEALFYNWHTHDIFKDEEHYALLQEGIEQAYGGLEQSIASLEQSLS